VRSTTAPRCSSCRAEAPRRPDGARSMSRRRPTTPVVGRRRLQGWETITSARGDLSPRDLELCGVRARRPTRGPCHTCASSRTRSWQSARTSTRHRMVSEGRHATYAHDFGGLSGDSEGAGSRGAFPSIGPGVEPPKGVYPAASRSGPAGETPEGADHRLTTRPDVAARCGAGPASVIEHCQPPRELDASAAVGGDDRLGTEHLRRCRRHGPKEASPARHAGRAGFGVARYGATQPQERAGRRRHGLGDERCIGRRREQQHQPFAALRKRC
jgi:hypothetical protein